MQPRTLNKVRNPDFRLGVSPPRHWRLEAASRRAACLADGTPGVVLCTGAAKTTVFLTQSVACRPNQHYRVEVTATCDLAAEGDACGLVLEVVPQPEARRLRLGSGGALAQVEACGPVQAGRSSRLKPAAQRGDGGGATRVVTPGVHRAVEPVTVRAYYQTPRDIRSVALRVGIRDARGSARLMNVRMLAILEPEQASHLLAIPPPPVQLAPPLAARRILVVTAAPGRPLVSLLRGAPGVESVEVWSPEARRLESGGADAVILADDAPPRGLSTVSALKKLAAERVVIVSTAAFARLAGADAAIRCVEQEDDPIHAAVACGGWPTRGFALRDAFPFAWPGRAPGSFVQRHFKRTGAFKTFCERHGLTTLLTSLCNRDVTSDRAVALLAATAAGALVVADVLPAESPPSTLAEPVTAVHFLMGLLGLPTTGLGQYAVPEGSAGALRAALREAVERFDAFRVHDDDVPAAELMHQLVTVGGGGTAGSFGNVGAARAAGASGGPPRAAQSTILIRSGLRSGDVESFYAAMTWFKQLVRMTPHSCPYAEELISRFRLAWIPLAADWEPGGGWRRRGAGPRLPFELDVEQDGLAALIDVVCRPVNRVCVAAPPSSDEFERTSMWLRELARSFGPPPVLTWDVDEGRSFCDRSNFTWRVRRHRVDTRIEPGLLADPVARGAVQAGARVFRLELPARDSDFVAHSIHLTDAAATTLEHVVGIVYGLIAVNRRPGAVQFDGFGPIAPGEALVVARGDPALELASSRAG